MSSLETLLEKTSRTFALSIPVLPEPTRREVMIAYLLFRIADTFEDAAHWEPARRIGALREFAALLDAFSPDEARKLARNWSAAGPSPHAGYRELIDQVPAVLEAFFSLDPAAVASVRAHVVRSCDGMARYVARTRGGALVLSDVADLQAYCYVVAGIVGEMLTELFLLGRPELTEVAPFLRERAAKFGEALQLVNILKDASADASEGRSYLPPGVPRPRGRGPLHRCPPVGRRSAGVGGVHRAAGPAGPGVPRSNREARSGLEDQPSRGLSADAEIEAFPRPEPARRSHKALEPQGKSRLG